MSILITQASQSPDAVAPAPDVPQDYVVIYENGDPFCGMLPPYGADIYSRQGAAVRFVPNGEYYIKAVGLWFMNNGRPRVPEILVTLRDDDNSGGASRPGRTVLEEWRFKVSAQGWNPVLEVLNSARTPMLERGKRYWISAESGDQPRENGVWNFSGCQAGFSSFNAGPRTPWEAGANGGVPAMTVWGIPPVE